MHVAEQPAEVSACIEEYGRSPVALLETEGLLSNRLHCRPRDSCHAESDRRDGARGRNGLRVSDN